MASPTALNQNFSSTVDSAGSNELIVTTDNANVAAYRAAVYNQAAVTNATDVFQIVGSASKTVRIKRVRIEGVPGIATAASQEVALFRRSTAGSGATVTAVTTVAKHDTNSAAATAVINQLTATAQTAGTAAGTLGVASLYFAAATGAAVPVLWEFSTRSDQALVLRGASDFVTIGFAGTTPGAGFNIEVEWEEV